MPLNQSTEGVFYIVLLFDICIGFSSKFGKVKVTQCLAAKPLNERNSQPTAETIFFLRCSS